MPNIAQFFLATILITSCSPATKESSTLNVAYSFPIESLDWTKHRALMGIEESIAEPLIRYHFKNGKPYLEPALFLDWQSDPSLKRWIFRFRKNLVWSDGKEFHPQAFLDTFERVMNPKNASEFGLSLSIVKGVRDYVSGKEKNFSKIGIKLVGTDQIEFQLNEAASYFPHLLTQYAYAPIRKDLISKYGNQWTSPDHFVGLGPYLIKKNELGNYLLLEENHHYYRNVHFKKIKFLMIDKPETAVRLFENKKVDIVLTLPFSRMRDLIKKPSFHSLYRGMYSVMVFNGKHKNPVKKQIRQKIFQIIDREQLAKLASSWFVSDTKNSFSWPMTFSTPLELQQKEKGNFDTGVSKKGNRVLIAEYVQREIKKKLGVDVEIKVFSAKHINNLFENGAIQSDFTYISPDVLSPHFFLALFSQKSANWIVQFPTPRIDKLVEKMKIEKNEFAIQALFKNAGKIIKENSHIIPLFEVPETWLARPNIKGIRVNHAAHVDFSFARESRGL